MKKKRISEQRMRVSFDLDEVLFINPDTHKAEPALKFPFNKIFIERLRFGTPELIHRLQDEGFDVWIYTSSFRSERYIRTLFGLYRVRLDGIINGTRHLKEVQGKRKEIFPQKMPCKYRISLHIDDEAVILTAGKKYGFNVYQLEAQDDDWKEKILERVYQIRKMEKANSLEGEKNGNMA